MDMKDISDRLDRVMEKNAKLNLLCDSLLTQVKEFETLLNEKHAGSKLFINREDGVGVGLDRFSTGWKVVVGVSENNCRPWTDSSRRIKLLSFDMIVRIITALEVEVDHLITGVQSRKQ